MSSIGTISLFEEDKTKVNSLVIQLAERVNSPPIQSPSYAASVALDAAKADIFITTVTNTSNFAVAAPTGPQNGQAITVTIRNTAGGALGTITWNAVFKMPTFTAPANGFSRSVNFFYNGTNWVQRWQSAADVPN